MIVVEGDGAGDEEGGVEDSVAVFAAEFFGHGGVDAGVIKEFEAGVFRQKRRWRKAFARRRS